MKIFRVLLLILIIGAIVFISNNDNAIAKTIGWRPSFIRMSQTESMTTDISVSASGLFVSEFTPIIMIY